jgi:hypothetical protein
MRVAAAALIAACALTVLAGPASADVRQATLGDVTARLSLTSRGGSVDDLRLVLTRAGTTVFARSISTASGRPGSLVRTPPTRRFLDVRLHVLDLDGDGTGEAVVDLDERGAYCCSHSVIVGAGPDGVYRPLALDWGSFGSAPHYERVGQGYAIVGRDARLEERYTPHVLSFEPVRIWAWQRGALRDVSHEQPRLVRRDLTLLLATRRELLRSKDHASIDLRGLFAAIAGDRWLLGEQGTAIAELGWDVAYGRVQVASVPGPTGTRFPLRLLSLLVELGY